MNHTFQGAGEACTKCKQNKIAHTEEATCECCTNVGPVELMYGNMLMCAACVEKERDLQKANASEGKQQERMNVLIKHSREVDNTIQIKSDIFNAATVAIVEIKAAIDLDASIENKQLAYAEEIDRRLTHLKEVIAGKRAELQQKENEARAFQVNLQNVVSQLSAELREKFRQADINYQPSTPKVIKPKERKPSNKKFQQEEVNKFAAQYDVPAATIQMLIVAKNLTPEHAAIHMRNTLDGKVCDCPSCKDKKVG